MPIFRFPRVRGDVPQVLIFWSISGMFSPRARGCSASRKSPGKHGYVFPACAGMFPCSIPMMAKPLRFPRVRGDVPRSAAPQWTRRKFSPRARGCSYLMSTVNSNGVVFPACAGMFRRASHQQPTLRSFPRVRGDVPQRNPQNVKTITFSPRARGCSAVGRGPLEFSWVFPACAGMFLGSDFPADARWGFPRVRGDVPE